MSRTLFSNAGDWELVNDAQDIRGFTAVDGTGAPVGLVESLIVDTDAEMVSAVRLDTGDEVPAFDITIGDGVVYLAGSIPGAATVGEIPERVAPVAIPGAAPRVVRRAAVVVPAPDAHAAAFQAHHATRVVPILEPAAPAVVPVPAAGYDAVEAAYRHGYAAAHAEAHRNRAFADAEPDIRTAYPPERDYDAERDAVRYGFDRAQRPTG